MYSHSAIDILRNTSVQLNSKHRRTDSFFIASYNLHLSTRAEQLCLEAKWQYQTETQMSRRQTRGSQQSLSSKHVTPIKGSSHQRALRGLAPGAAATNITEARAKVTPTLFPLRPQLKTSRHAVLEIRCYLCPHLC